MNIFNFKAISTKHLFTNKKIAVVSVINDLVTDVRVNKICNTLLDCQYNVILIGRQLPDSKPIRDWSFKAIRMKLIFRTGPLFYLFFNLRLFFRLIFQKADLLYANDLDTLLPNYLVSKIKRVPLIYDSHELFCEVPELKHHPLKRTIWLKLESWILPKLNNNITVSESIAYYYNNKYKTHFEVVRNIPPSSGVDKTKKGRKELGIAEDKKMILLQGAGINIDRGAEELIEAMTMVNDAVLYIIGSGDVWDILLQKIKTLHLENKVVMINKLPKDELMHYTANADIGFSIDKNTNLNYYFSLPNKLFDYIDAEIPVLASRLKEIENIIDEYKIGSFIENHQPKHIAEKINQLLVSDQVSEYRKNTKIAKQALNWENERIKLIKCIEQASQI